MYGPIRLISHALKIFKCTDDQKPREIVKVIINQWGFVSNTSVTDAIDDKSVYSLRSKEKQKNIHSAFLYLKKAFERVHMKLFDQFSKKKKSSQDYNEWIKLIYKGAKHHAWCSVGVTRKFPLKVEGMHQGSVLPSLLFITLMDTVMCDTQTTTL